MFHFCSWVSSPFYLARVLDPGAVLTSPVRSCTSFSACLSRFFFRRSLEILLPSLVFLTQDLVALLRVLLAAPKFCQFLVSGRETVPRSTVRFCRPPLSFSRLVPIFCIDLCRRDPFQVFPARIHFRPPGVMCWLRSLHLVLSFRL
jgi:hypothetical protein